MRLQFYPARAEFTFIVILQLLDYWWCKTLTHKNCEIANVTLLTLVNRWAGHPSSQRLFPVAAGSQHVIRIRIHNSYLCTLYTCGPSPFSPSISVFIPVDFLSACTNSDTPSPRLFVYCRCQFVPLCLENRACKVAGPSDPSSRVILSPRPPCSINTSIYYETGLSYTEQLCFNH